MNDIEKKQKRWEVTFISLAVLAILGFGVSSYLKMKDNYQLQQNINKVQIPDKLTYKPAMSASQVASKKALVEQRLNEFLKDKLDVDYKEYDKARSMFRSIFFASSGRYDATETNTHEEKVAFFKDFTYIIEDVSGTYNEKGQAEIFLKMTVYLDGQPITKHSFFKLILDEQGRVVGGAVYGE